MSDGICTLPGSCGVPCEAGSAGGATELAETTEGRTVQFPCNWTDTDPAAVLEAVAELNLEGITLPAPGGMTRLDPVR